MEKIRENLRGLLQDPELQPVDGVISYLVSFLNAKEQKLLSHISFKDALNEICASNVGYVPVKVIDVNSTKITITTKCSHCGKRHTYSMSYKQFFQYTFGLDLIQCIFPEFSGSEREELLTGLCESCWDQLMCEELRNCLSIA